MPGYYGISTANAAYDLAGPGYSNSVVDDSGGFHSTSYAYENAYGAIYEHNTFSGTFANGVTEYRVGSYGFPGTGDERYGYSRVYTSDSYGPPLVGGYGRYDPYGYANPDGKATETTYATRAASYSGSTEQLSTITQTSIDYVNGANESSYSSLSETLSGGHLVLGSYHQYTLSSYTSYGSYYGTYTSSEVTR